mmetsp:Transcript_10210/g.19787  ORF Transcript_10210/g.19787 Transcript_10210/m.19787 type:complete len:110 (-) Transcript_10210:153-482(-)
MSFCEHLYVDCESVLREKRKETRKKEQAMYAFLIPQIFVCFRFSPLPSSLCLSLFFGDILKHRQTRRQAHAPKQCERETGTSRCLPSSFNTTGREDRQDNSRKDSKMKK